MKSVVLAPVPSGVVTLIRPVVAVFGTFVVIDVAETIVKVALTLLNVTDVAPVKFRPVIVTPATVVALVGLKLSTLGVTTKLVELASVPSGLVTLIVAVIAPDGTVALI
jgi:hypothetical protein